ncbi:riboflavin synthase [Sulfurihydrogenibium azorense]|jgi:riboflavin synthase|uniref:riboflavin synthase n=1 Tax=Sulfurihydrogenibium azorense TaxID=309806 RepID=UPI002409E204|nr:riboflavin synthase [Sulfurihydrogenibium azorense]MDM7274304.1 riboflavin synthase [Sulfurihydrogenibium azorense]
MFTGLIEEVGKVKSVIKNSDGMRLVVSCRKVLDGTVLGDSIAVNGVCLTVVDMDKESASFDVSQETIKRSNFSFLKTGDYVNLERSLTPQSRLGGHIVQGHVDTTGSIVSKTSLGSHTNFKISFSPEYKNLVIEKGSIAIDGISLTVNYINENIIDLNIIPHTLENTNLKYRKVGDVVNIEFDILGKYVAKMIGKWYDKDEKLKNLLENW